MRRIGSSPYVWRACVGCLLGLPVAIGLAALLRNEVIAGVVGALIGAALANLRPSRAGGVRAKD